MKKESGQSESSSAAAASTSRAPATKAHEKMPKPHSDTSERAKDSYRDAEASQKVFESFLQGFTKIQWFARPHYVEPM